MRSKLSAIILAIGMASALTLTLGAGTAHAKNDVRNGFEREIGRILARTFVGAVSHGIVHAPRHTPRRYARPHRPARPRTVVVVKPPPRRHAYHAPHRPHRPHYRPPAHRHHHGCGHRGHRGHDGVWFFWGN